MLKSIALAVVCAGLVLCGIGLLETFYGPVAQSRAQEMVGPGWVNGERLHHLLHRLPSRQEKQPTAASSDEWLSLLLAPSMMELVLLFLFMVISMTSFLCVLALRRSFNEKSVKEKHTKLSSDADAATQDEKDFNDVLCCHFTPYKSKNNNTGDMGGVKLYNIVVKGYTSGSTCAQLKITVQTRRTMTREELSGLEEAILQSLNHHKEYVSSHQHLLEIVYDSAVEYLREHDFMDDTPERAEALIGRSH